ncbi:MAG: hypothetical protein COS35_06500 [Zetaproteobacteria bacterium CG02_land_8_20_14_3_00_50_9]|nr:MAG: hypothetical protein AUJ57_07765 [Zetaproteobacteria bacterium CG1_02_53_45]PIV30490.1 MAG: hypothetical protein COS35_06500 [Zetaproteobacteria bacterium CG02_land_8_20_14_3_00_50_9]
MAFQILPLQSIVTRLEDQAVGFKSLAGAAELEQAIAGGVRVAPAGFVVPLKEDAGANTTGTMIVTQDVTTRFAIVFAVKDLSDRSGKSAIDGGLRDLRIAVGNALVGWAPAGFNICEWDGGSIVRIGGGTVYWRDRYRTSHINEL